MSRSIPLDGILALLFLAIAIVLRLRIPLFASSIIEVLSLLWLAKVNLMRGKKRLLTAGKGPQILFRTRRDECFHEVAFAAGALRRNRL